MQLTRQGENIDVLGKLPEVGEKAPSFSLTSTDGKTVSSEDLKGDVVILSVFPDIATSVCDAQTRSFNEAASNLEGIRLVSVSKNSKEELQEWCAAKGLEMEMLPDADGSFGDAFGIKMDSIDKLTRSVWVIDQEGTLAYKEIVQEMTNEPNYEAAVEAAKDLL